jgi:hypothetical protein
MDSTTQPVPAATCGCTMVGWRVLLQILRTTDSPAQPSVEVSPKLASTSATPSAPETV